MRWKPYPYAHHPFCQYRREGTDCTCAEGRYSKEGAMATIKEALNTLSVGLAELAEALNETPDSVRSGGSEAGTVARPAPTTFADGRPIEEPPLFPDQFSGPVDEARVAELRQQPSLADQSTEFAPPAQTERDRVLGECPVHQVRWTIKPGGVSAKTGQPYSSFWKCAEKDEDGSYCNRKPVKDWVKTHDPEKALAAA